MTAIIEIYANNARSVLASSITAVATTLYVNSSDAALFPTPIPGKEFFRLRLTSASAPNSIEEIVFVTERVGNEFSIIRGQEGSTPQAWNVNDPCWNAVTAGTCFQFMQPYYGANTTGQNFYTVNTHTYASAYFTGMLVMFTPLLGNTITNPTLNVNGLGAVIITNSDGSSLLPGQIPDYSVVGCVFNATESRWELMSLNGVAVTPPTGDNSEKIATTRFVKNVAAQAGQIPSGVKMLFMEATAPAGWTQVTTYNNYALRLVNGTGAGTGGSVNFSTAFSNQSISGTIGGTALTVDQLPAHNHSGSTGDQSTSHTHITTWHTITEYYASGGVEIRVPQYVGGSLDYIQSGGTSNGHTHSLTTNNTGGGNTHTHSLSGASVNLAVKYVDIIVCSKD